MAKSFSTRISLHREPTLCAGRRPRYCIFPLRRISTKAAPLNCPMTPNSRPLRSCLHPQDEEPRRSGRATSRESPMPRSVCSLRRSLRAVAQVVGEDSRFVVGRGGIRSVVVLSRREVTPKIDSSFPYSVQSQRVWISTCLQR